MPRTSAPSSSEPLKLYGEDSAQLRTLPDFFAALAKHPDFKGIHGGTDFPIDVPVVPDADTAEVRRSDVAERLWEIRDTLLRLLRASLENFDRGDGKKMLLEDGGYPAPGGKPFFKKTDLDDAVLNAASLLDPKDPHFNFMVTDPKLGATAMLGYLHDALLRSRDPQAVFELLRMYTRPDRETGKNVKEISLDERRKLLNGRANSVIAAVLRGDNLRKEQLFNASLRSKRFPGDMGKMVASVMSMFDQAAARVKINSLKREESKRDLFNLLFDLIKVKSLPDGFSAAVMTYTSSITMAGDERELTKAVAVFIGAMRQE